MLGFVVCRTEVAERRVAALTVVEASMHSKIAVLAAARIICRGDIQERVIELGGAHRRSWEAGASHHPPRRPWQRSSRTGTVAPARPAYADPDDRDVTRCRVVAGMPSTWLPQVSTQPGDRERRCCRQVPIESIGLDTCAKVRNCIKMLARPPISRHHMTTTRAAQPARKRQSRLKYVLIAVFVLAALVSIALIVVPILLLYKIPVPDTPALASNTGLTSTDVISLVVVGATLLLALLTGSLALFTRLAVLTGREEARVANDAVELSREQNAIARESLEASWRPVLVDVPLGKYFTGTSDPAVIQVAPPSTAPLSGSVPFRNVGSGPAIVKAGAVSADGVAWVVSFSSTIVPLNEITQVSFAIPRDRPELKPMVESIERRNPFIASLSYTDQGGRNIWVSKAHVVPTARGWEVRQIDLHLEGSEQPPLVSGPTSSTS